MTRRGTSQEVVDRLLGEALDALGRVIPFDLATIMELDGEELRVRVARGPLDAPAVHAHRLSLRDFPSIREVLRDGHARAFLEHDHAEGDGDPFDGVLDLDHGHSCMVAPLRAGPDTVGVMTLDRAVCGAYPPGYVELADVFGRLLALAIAYGEQSLRLDRLRVQLEEQNRVLRERVEGAVDPGGLVDACPSPAMRRVADLARHVAPTEAPVLITGETGTGKEVLASAIHGWSLRADKPLITLNCAALPGGLIESELFGHVRGAFTGATGARAGRFQAANGGTLFLDEVGDIPLDVQAKLLRVLQEGTFEAVGSDRTVRVDVRVLAATNVDLQRAVAERRFREDLYYRLAVFPIHVPPLRARPEDVGVIARNVLARLAARTGRGPWRLEEADVRWLAAQPWPGNVRELVNALERATILAGGDRLDVAAAARVGLEPAPASRPEPPAADAPFPTLEAHERRHILAALERTDGQIWGPGGAAELLGMHPSTLQSRMKKHGLGGARAWRRRRRPEGGGPEGRRPVDPAGRNRS